MNRLGVAHIVGTLILVVGGKNSVLFDDLVYHSILNDLKRTSVMTLQLLLINFLLSSYVF